MTVRDLPLLLAAVRDRATGIGSPIHGEHHWLCVAHVGGGLVREVPAADPLVVFLFGLLHDTMRENDGFDPDHGPRAAAFARTLVAEGVLTLDPSRLDVLCEACDRHTCGETSTDGTIGVCWDADRLNLWRVGITPDPVLLSTGPARTSEWIARAPELAHAELDWHALYEDGGRSGREGPSAAGSVTGARHANRSHR